MKKELKETRKQEKLAQAIQPVILDSLAGTKITGKDPNNLHSINDYPLYYMAKTNTEAFKNYMKMSPDEFKSDAINLFGEFDRITRNNLVELLTNSIISSTTIIASNWLINYCDANREISSILSLKSYINSIGDITCRSKISEILYNFIKDYINGYNYNHYETINTVIAHSEFAIDTISVVISSELATAIDACINNWLNCINYNHYDADLDVFKRIIPNENWSSDGDIIADKFVTANVSRFNYTRYLNNAMNDIRFAIGNIIYYIPYTLFYIYSDARETALSTNDTGINHISKSVNRVESEDKEDEDIDYVSQEEYNNCFKQAISNSSDKRIAVTGAVKDKLVKAMEDAGFHVTEVKKF